MKQKLSKPDLSISNFNIAYDFLIENMDEETKEYIRRVLMQNDQSMLRIIRKFSEN